MAISKPNGGAVSLGVTGALNKDYRIDSRDGWQTETWQALGMLATNEAGKGEGMDSAAGTVMRRFYRALLLPEIVPTTRNAAGTEDTDLVITLEGNDPVYPGSVLQAVITQLPANGWLQQMDGTAITAPGVVVTDGSNKVRYLPEANASGNRVAAFAYFLRRVTNGVTSSAAMVGIDLAEVNDPPVATTPRPQVTEDTELRFQMTAFDPDPAETVRFKIIDPCVAGRLYQVNRDNVTKGAVIFSQNVFVTNPNGYLIYVPPPNANGYAYETFSYIAVDSHNAESTFVVLPIDIAAVNDAPVATATSHTGQNNDAGVNLTLTISDVEASPLLIHFTELPDRGALYYQTIAPENAVTIGQSYSNNSFVYVSAHPYESGSPYTHFSYYVTDPEGLTSATVTDTINLVYVNSPPTPTSPGSYTLPQNTTLNFNLTASDPDGDHPTFYINSLPQHGKLYFRSGSTYVDLSNQTLPIQLVTSGNTAQMRYIPTTNFNNTQGLDEFRYQVRDATEFNNTVYSVTFNVTP